MQTYLVAERFRKALDRQTRIGERRRNWMSRSQIAFNSGDLAFQGILMLRPYRDGATNWFPRTVFALTFVGSELRAWHRFRTDYRLTGSYSGPEVRFGKCQ